jgi:hypothetical protein
MARLLVAKLTPFTGRSTQNGNLSGFAFALVREKVRGQSAPGLKRLVLLVKLALKPSIGVRTRIISCLPDFET